VANFQTRKVTVNTPQSTTIPPQTHHQKTTRKHSFPPKTPAKRPNPSVISKKVSSAGERRPGVHRNFVEILRVRQSVWLLFSAFTPQKIVALNTRRLGFNAGPLTPTCVPQPSGTITSSNGAVENRLRDWLQTFRF
jgi:hypothetical protein